MSFTVKFDSLTDAIKIQCELVANRGQARWRHELMQSDQSQQLLDEALAADTAFSAALQRAYTDPVNRA